MKKLKRLIASISALILMISILGTSASAKAESLNGVSNQEALFDPSLYIQTLLSEEAVFEDGVQVGTLRQYKFVPQQQSLGITNTCVLMAEYTTRGGTTSARLTGYFMFDGESASCFDSDVWSNLPEFEENSRKVTGNGSSKATLKLSFQFRAILKPAYQSLTLWCDKNGKNGS